MSHSQLIISPRLKQEIDKYVRYVNIVNVVLFTKTSTVNKKYNSEEAAVQMYQVLK